MPYGLPASKEMGCIPIYFNCAECVDIWHKLMYMYVYMKVILWDPNKNKKLKDERGISFEEVLICIENEQILDIIKNPGKERETQKVFVVQLHGYVYYVPFVETDGEVFLKTIVPSRKLTKRYQRQEEE